MNYNIYFNIAEYMDYDINKHKYLLAILNGEDFKYYFEENILPNIITLKNIPKIKSEVSIKKIKTEVMEIIEIDIVVYYGDNKVPHPYNIFSNKKLEFITGDYKYVDEYNQSESSYDAYEWYLYNNKYIIYIYCEYEGDFSWNITKYDYFNSCENSLKIYDIHDINNIFDNLSNIDDRVKIAKIISSKIFENEKYWKDIICRYIFMNND